MTVLKAMKITIPVTAKMISNVLNGKDSKYIKRINVEINEPTINICVTFIIWKFENKVVFSMIPVNTDSNRSVTFKLIKIKPKVLSIIRFISFKKHGLIKLNKGYITINFNGIKKIKEIKHGNITKIQIRNKILWCKIEM